MSRIKRFLLIALEVVVESTKFFLAIYLIYRVYDVLGYCSRMISNDKNPIVFGLIALAGAYLLANSKIPDSLKDYLKN